MRRRAIVVFVPEPTAGHDDLDVRRRWDPVMAGRIAAHLTLIHDVVDPAAADDRLAAVTSSVAPFDIAFGPAATWGAAARGIYLGIADPTDRVGALHDQLAPVEDPRWLRHGFRPHVTVVHGRYVSAETAEAAWHELRGWWPRQRTTIDRLSVIEMHDHGWETVAEHRLAASPAVAPPP
ncbi:MAG: 2'-5' RNA ligase family protein [Desertimonas sp.]